MILQDVRYALRTLSRSKGFATVAILCLGFGIGLNATIFSLIDGVLLKPYPYTDPDRILVVGEQKPKTNDDAGLSYLDMRDWKEANTVFSTITAVSGRSLTISDGQGEPQRTVRGRPRSYCHTPRASDTRVRRDTSARFSNSFTSRTPATNPPTCAQTATPPDTSGFTWLS